MQKTITIYIIYESHGWQIWFKCEDVAILTCALGCSSWTPTFACHFSTAIPRCQAQGCITFHGCIVGTGTFRPTYIIQDVWTTIRFIQTAGNSMRIFFVLSKGFSILCCISETFNWLFPRFHIHLSVGRYGLLVPAPMAVVKGTRTWLLGWDTQDSGSRLISRVLDGENPIPPFKRLFLRKRHHRCWIRTTNCLVILERTQNDSFFLWLCMYAMWDSEMRLIHQ